MNHLSFISSFWRLGTLSLTSGLLCATIQLLILPQSPKKQQQFGRALQQFLEKAGPAFIKLGQFISTRPDIVGQEIATELRSLQDRVKPIPLARLAKKLPGYRQLATQITIDNKPVAAGSIAQIHHGTLIASGQHVAVKILRPRIKKTFSRDLAIVEAMVALLNLFIAPTRRLKLRESINIVRQSMEIETNMLLEAAANNKMQENATRHQLPIAFPGVFWNLSSKEILVMEWVDGISLNDTDTLAAHQVNLEKTCHDLAISFFTQAHKDGFFHADIHGGNILIDKQTHRIYLLDWGIVSFLKPRDRLAIARIMHAFINGNYDKVAEIHADAGYINREQSPDMFALACRSIATPINDLDSCQISMAELLGKILSIINDFNMEGQPQLLLLQKSMISLEGVLRSLSPELNMWKIAKPWFDQWQRDNVGGWATTKLLLGLANNQFERLYSSYTSSAADQTCSAPTAAAAPESSSSTNRDCRHTRSHISLVSNDTARYLAKYKRMRALFFCTATLFIAFIIHLL